MKCRNSSLPRETLSPFLGRNFAIGPHRGSCDHRTLPSDRPSCGSVRQPECRIPHLLTSCGFLVRCVSRGPRSEHLCRGNPEKQRQAMTGPYPGGICPFTTLLPAQEDGGAMGWGSRRHFTRSVMSHSSPLGRALEGDAGGSRVDGCLFT